MSIATQLTELAANRDAIKAAIEAKGVADAGDTLAEFPAAIASISSGGGGAPETEPYPWVGSGTHAWVHYDAQSRSHGLSLKFRYTGNCTLDWGDGSPVVSLTGGSATLTTQNHTYADGDFRLDITGEYPITINQADAYYVGMFAYAETELSPNLTRVPQYRDMLIQFESDVLSWVGNGNDGYSPLGATRNMRWMKLTECQTLGGAPFASALDLISFSAPKLTTISVNTNMPLVVNIKRFDIPLVKDLSNISWFGYAMPLDSLEEFTIPSDTTALATTVLSNVRSLKKLNLPSTLNIATINGLCGNAYCLTEVTIPEGVETLSGDTMRYAPLERIDLPSTLISIPAGTSFSSTYPLHTLICRATTPPTLGGSGIFKQHLANAKYYIPYGTTAAYTAATNWSQFSSLFVELNQDGTIPQA